MSDYLYSWSEEESNSSKRPKTETDTSAKPTPKTYGYQCPICSKQYLSVSGFRGHVVNKHKRCDLKASQHKLSDTGKADVAATPACDQEITKTSSDIITFTDNSFPQLLESAVLEVLNNPNHNSTKSKSGRTMVHIGKIVMSSPDMMQELGTVLKPPFLDTLAVFGRANSFSADKELMWSKFHSMRTNFDLCARLRSVVLQVANETEMHVHFFIQCLLDDLIRCAITNFTSSLQKETEKSVESFTDENIRL